MLFDYQITAAFHCSRPAVSSEDSVIISRLYNNGRSSCGGVVIAHNYIALHQGICCGKQHMSYLCEYSSATNYRWHRLDSVWTLRTWMSYGLRDGHVTMTFVYSTPCFLSVFPMQLIISAVAGLRRKVCASPTVYGRWWLRDSNTSYVSPTWVVGPRPFVSVYCVQLVRLI